MLSEMATGICKEVWAFQIEARVKLFTRISLCLNLSNASCFSFVPNIPVCVQTMHSVSELISVRKEMVELDELWAPF